MKITSRQLPVLYFTTICLLTIYTLTSIKECEAYWMHDASITISKQKLLGDTSFLFLVPLIIIIIQAFLKIKTQTNLFLTQFFIAVTSIIFFVFATNKPCDNINGGHYMFINSILTLGYYLFKLISIVIIGIMIIQTIRSKNKCDGIEKT